MRDKVIRRRGERGSALLIVFVMAAAVAIMLYMEMPVAAFEAQREREQQLIDRGNEYAHAVKLFVRKLGNYPASLDALENTNRMRFLRHRFKDPFTGKDDWRLLHAGPGGTLIDSKVNPINTNAPGQNKQGGSGTASPGASATADSGFAGFNNSFSTATSSSTGNSPTGEAIVPTIPQRPPAIAANGGGPPASSGAVADANASPTAPLLPSTPAETADAAAAQTQAPQTGTAPAGTPGIAVAGVNPQTSVEPEAPTQMVQAGTSPASGPGVAVGGLTPQMPGQPGVQMPGQAGAQVPGLPNPAMSTSPGTTAPGATGVSGSGSTLQRGASTTTGQVMSGGIAGVSSKAQGHTIKLINDQADYSLWEFYYDPSKDAMRLGAGAAANTQSGRTVPGQVGSPGSGIGATTPASSAMQPQSTSTLPQTLTPQQQ